jgi:glycosyltransferase involved in cell wall biosynthesis
MKVAFVPPWYGVDIPGGAEAEVRRTAEHLKCIGVPVEILTTCVKDFHSDWGRNYHRPGISVENGVTVRRFRVRHRNRAAFDSVNLRLMHGHQVSLEEELTYVTENVRSDTLERYIASHASEYIFVFIPYMFGTTYWGIQACRGKALLIPCLHDEPYTRMQVFHDMFQKVQRLILHVEAEKRLIQALYHLPPERLVLMGEGVDTDWTAEAKAFTEHYGLSRSFILYAGRKGKGKNVETLVDYFLKYQQSSVNEADLVFIGSGTLSDDVRDNQHIHDLGFVPAAQKYNAYAAASVLCQPSLHESFSLVIMEAWLAGTPVLVHNDCEVTKEHCLRSNGGLFFKNYGEFEMCLELLLKNKRLRDTLATNGRHYVLNNYHWDIITERYRRLFEGLGVR